MTIDPSIEKDDTKKKLEEALKKICPLFPLIKELEINERLREEEIKNLNTKVK